MVKISLMASEEMSFENVDVDDDDGRTDDRCLSIHKLTYKPAAQVS